ncbi:MAG: L-threonine 3-dehydrogenase [Candidatus Aenigmarchaeota archaeon]|nr:L-threonine 3-dehydrogenase [Candidatus Aenigmarchaeota archaeon]
MATMRAVRKLRPAEGFELAEIPVPQPKAGELLVKVRAASVCGTDIHIYKWEPPWSQGRYVPPKTMGHEVCGEVVQAGPGVRGFQEGDSVSAESHIYDATCSQCLRGNQHICEKLQFFSIDTDGFWAEYAIIPQQNAWKNPPSLPPEIATLQESMGNSVYTVEEGQVKDKFVAIFGLGPTGLFATGIAKALGATAVAVVGGSDTHLQIAKRMGADAVVNRHQRDPVQAIKELTNDKGADVVLEMSGAPQAIQQALESVRPVGRVCALGLPTQPVTLDLSKLVVLKDLTFRGIYGRRIWDTWKTTSRLLQEGLDISPVITHRLPLARFQEGIRAMMQGESGKVILLP